MDVRSFGSFGAVSVPPLYDENGNPNSTAFQPGDAGEIVIVRTSLRWTYHTPLLSHAMGSATRELTSVQVFRNEPFRGPI
jgi:hypothetical protein